MRYTDPTEPKTYRTNYSRVLHRAAAEGKTIVADAGPDKIKGQELRYEPRTPNDSRPWRPVKQEISAYRFSGRECRVLESIQFSLERSDGEFTVLARRNGATVGHLTWHRHTRVVRYVWVAPEYRRRGIATGMWHTATSFSSPVSVPVHAPLLSEDGEAWVASL
jgi:hypothetical protein